ncbi:MAG: META domain-containing protein [Hyphomonadaceae bacterium]
MRNHRHAASFVFSGVAAFALFAFASASTQAQAAVSRRDIAGTNWTLQSLAGQPINAENAPTLAFGPQYRLSGNGGCNPFFGVYGESRSNDVVIRTVDAAGAQCDAPVMTQEQTFLDILRTAHSIELEDNGVLTVTSGDGRVAQLRARQ